MDVASTLLAGTSFQMNYFNTFLGIQVILPGSGYPSSVIPIIVSVWIAAKFEHYFKSKLPESVNGVLTQVFTLAISVVGRIIVGALLGGGFGVLVMFGVRWTVIGLGPFIGIAQGITLIGDVLGETTLLQFPECVDIETYQKSLEHLNLESDRFDTVLRFHGNCISKKSIIKDSVDLCGEILMRTDAKIPIEMHECKGYLARNKEHPGTSGNILYNPNHIYHE